MPLRKRRLLVPAVLLALAAAAPPALAVQAPADSATSDWTYASRRQAMVANIERVVSAGTFGARRTVDRRVLAAMRDIPRHLFVPAAIREQAYSDSALPIGHGATISQPLIVAWMTHLLSIHRGQSVLEVGTGSGYQAAVLARLGARVYTIEIVPELARRAGETLAAQGFGEVAVRAGDGYKGWPEAAPFDAILVTAGATHVPAPLVDQLKPGGRMLIPTGTDPDRQHLLLVTKDRRGRVRQSRLSPVVFVPLVEPGRPGGR